MNTRERVFTENVMWDVRRLIRCTAFAFIGVLSIDVGIAQTPAASPSSAKENKILYRFCSGGRSQGCTYPGKGFAVCEKLLKMLNTYGAQAHPSHCQLSMHPDFPLFSRPAWEMLDPMQNVELTYKMDRSIAPPGNLRRTMSFAQWREAFERERTGGEINPELRLARLQISANETISVLSYSRYAGKCDAGTAAANVGPGQFLRVYNESSGQIDEQDTMLGHQLFDILKFGSKYFLVQAMFRPPLPTLAGEEKIVVYRLEPTRRDDWPSLTIKGVPTEQCDLRAEFPQSGDQRTDR